jgi:hypothetical protein
VIAAEPGPAVVPYDFWNKVWPRCTTLSVAPVKSPFLRALFICLSVSSNVLSDDVLADNSELIPTPTAKMTTVRNKNALMSFAHMRCHAKTDSLKVSLFFT